MKLESTIHINAPPELVWDVTVDVEQWPQWTPTVQSVRRVDRGELAVGSAVVIKQPGLPEAEWVVDALTPGEQFRWKTRIRGIRMIATHELTETPSGTQNVLGLEMSGLVARLLWPFIRRSARRSLEQENAGLKHRCESIL